jgi:hypothetical protein
MNEQQQQAKLAEIAVDEMRIGYGKFMVAYLKRVRKRAGIDQLTPAHIAVINRALLSGKPMEQPGALTDNDAADIANI